MSSSYECILKEGEKCFRKKKKKKTHVFAIMNIFLRVFHACPLYYYYI